MKKVFCLLLLAVVMFVGINRVYALLPYQENIKRVTLYTYYGTDGWTRKLVQNYYRMENVLKVISDKKETDKSVEKKDRITNMEFLYNDGSIIKVVFYGNNIIGITENGKEIMYEVDYGSDIEQTIINQFSDIKVGNESGNPQTGDNGLLIITLLLITSTVAVVAYRKQKLS